ncbi:hypothetical protein AB0230_01750 [Microbacterium sp. NPDC089190]|uniref:hypothetical protein n=1 Tax=Microbacterium sp. NPDC089190 TaxID=3155063 RepID=UPI00344F2FC4
MGKTHIVLAGVVDHRLTATGGKVGLQFPPNRIEFAAEGDEVTWQIRVLDVAGNPDSWSLSARFLDVIEHTTGPQYAKPEMVPFTALQTQYDVVERVGWHRNAPGAVVPATAGEFGVIAQSGDALPTQLSRTVRVRSLRHKIEFAPPAFVGGTNPSLGVALTYTVRSGRA